MLIFPHITSNHSARADLMVVDYGFHALYCLSSIAMFHNNLTCYHKLSCAVLSCHVSYDCFYPVLSSVQNTNGHLKFGCLLVSMFVPILYTALVLPIIRAFN